MYRALLIGLLYEMKLNFGGRVVVCVCTQEETSETMLVVCALTAFATDGGSPEPMKPYSVYSVGYTLVSW
jgi:hypothetical protein